MKIRISDPVWTELHRALVEQDHRVSGSERKIVLGVKQALYSTTMADHRSMVFSSSDPDAIAAMASACKTVIETERAEVDRPVYAPIKTACRRILRIMTRLLSPVDLRKS